jgi:protocatechuate 3,4-dioxygenase beta subunit
MDLPQNTLRQSDSMSSDRRGFLLGVGATLLAACSSATETDEVAPSASSTRGTPPPQSTPTSPTTAASPSSGANTTAGTGEVTPLTPADFEALPICAVLPPSTAGPFPTLEQLDRRDITEGYPGHPLRLGLRVVDAACAPIAGAEVEVWHTDATGDYSSYADGGSGKDEGAGTTFLRGFQTAGDDGIVEFLTIYPGWYEGRAVHIHVRVRVDGSEVLTSQLYFDDDYTAAIHATGEYAQFGPPDTTLADDGIAGDTATDGSRIILRAAPTERGDGTLGLVNLGIPT